MFQRLGKRYAAQSDEGFIVERIVESFFAEPMIRYIEDGRVINYYLQNLAPGAIDKIKVAEIRSWEPPHETEELSLEKRILIAERIKMTLEFLGDKSRVVY
jgi:hypothetical protein